MEYTDPGGLQLREAAPRAERGRTAHGYQRRRRRPPVLSFLKEFFTRFR